MHTLNIPDHWSPEQALAVYEFIQEILQAVTERYQLSLFEILRSQRIDQTDRSQLDLFESDDDFPSEI